MKNELFKENVIEEIKNKAKEMLDAGDEIQFIITGEDIISIKKRVATNLLTNFIPMGLGSNPIVTKSQEYLRLFFSNNGVVVVGLDYYRQPLNYEMIQYNDIKAAVVHEKDGVLELNTVSEKVIAVTLIKERYQQSIDNLKSKLDLRIENTKFKNDKK